MQFLEIGCLAEKSFAKKTRQSCLYFPVLFLCQELVVCIAPISTLFCLHPSSFL